MVVPHERQPIAILTLFPPPSRTQARGVYASVLLGCIPVSMDTDMALAFDGTLLSYAHFMLQFDPSVYNGQPAQLVKVCNSSPANL